MPLVSHADHAARIRERDAGWLAAVARRDLDGMMAIYAADAEELQPGLPTIVGRPAIRRFYRELLERFPRLRHEFDPHSVTVAAAADLAVVQGAYRFIADTHQPEQAEVGKFLGVWVHREDDWWLLRNISNADRPAQRSRPEDA